MTGAEKIVQALNGRWWGNFGLVQCVCHKDGATPALKISDAPKKTGGIDVICFAKCDWRDVKAELARLGLLDDSPPSDSITQEPQTPAIRSAAAARIWRSTSSDYRLVETYLRGRSITVPIPATLHYLASMKHKPSGRLFPAMVAAVTVWPSRQVTAVHRTYLTAGGTKAPVEPAKMSLGPCARGAVRLAPASSELGIAEGIETALSAMQMTGVPTWATLSTSGMCKVVLPAEAQNVVIFGDHDANGAGQAAAEALAARLKREGREVRISYPPTSLKDFNDALQAGATW